MFIRSGCIFMLLAVFTTGRSISDSGNQDALNNLLSRLGSHNNNSSDNLVFMPPTFSVDIISLLRWAVENTLSKKNSPLVKDLHQQLSGHPYTTKFMNLVDFNGKQYFFSKNQKLSWAESMSFCRAYSMELLSIETKQEDDFISNHLSSIGLNAQNVWTSAHKIGRSTFFWINEEPLVFENWAGGQPSHPQTEHCIVLHDKKWYDYPCIPDASHNFYCYFICESRDNE